MMMLVVEMDMSQAQKLNKKNHQETQEWLHSRVQHIMFQLNPYYRTVTEKKMIMNSTVKVERQCLLICVLIMIIMLEIHILKFVSFNKKLFKHPVLIFQHPQ